MLSLYLVSGIAGVADAHTLSGDESVPLQLGHQLLGLHHLPLTAILLFGGIVLYRFLHKSTRRDNRRPR
jgi:hypothetical protein